MKVTQQLRLAGPDIVHENFGGDLVILNLTSGQYFGLNAAGASVWQSVIAGQPVGDIQAEEGLVDAVAAFVAKLQEYALVVPSEDAAVAPTATSPIAEVPLIEVYDDLADLIVADPIHDVDADMGWPKMPGSE